jgi:hypothetical protein
MHSAQGALGPIKRGIALNKARIQLAGIELPLAIGAGEESSLIRTLFQINEKCPF